MRLFIAEKPSPRPAPSPISCPSLTVAERAISPAEMITSSRCVGHLLEQAQPTATTAAMRAGRWPTCLSCRKSGDYSRALGGEAAERDQKLLEQADEIIHAGDPDREGQLLVDEVLDYLALPPAKRERYSAV